MVKSRSAIQDFLDGISDEKLKNFVSSEKTIAKKDGYRLDHQGVSEQKPESIAYVLIQMIVEQGRFR